MAPPGTLDRTPPPFFRQGASARSQLALCAALAVFLMVADHRLQITQPLRATLATILLPLQHAALWPARLLDTLGDYGSGLGEAVAQNAALRQRLTAQSEAITRAARLEAENAELRALMGLRPAVPPDTVQAEVLFEAADRYSRKVMIDRGSLAGITLAAPVIHEAGLVGQVTRVYPWSAEVTLLQDQQISVPVLNQRTRQRGVAFGDGAEDAGMELRFVAANADVQVGDELVTSGLDAVYPPGLPVARVARVERQAETSFARIELAPVASADGRRHVLVLPIKPRSVDKAEQGVKGDRPEKADKAGKAESAEKADTGPRTP
ncbi:MAG: rod shape-determining protein MreC [Burkholderiales bacterium]|nr:rod shape-determining protein MreC [Burkholderiales bacterium]